MNNQNLKKYALPGLMTAAFVLGFLPVLQKLSIRWESGDNSYCYLIVPLFIYLCWEKKNDFHFGQFSWNLWGLVPVSLSIVTMIAGELGSVETLLYMGIWGGIAGILFILYGLRLQHLLFPLLILAFIVPLPPFVNRMLTFNLKLAASSLSVVMLRLTGVSVLQDGNIIDLGITQLQVVDACSGLRYFMPLVLMALLFGFFYCTRWWQKVVLLIVVPPLSVLVNGLRIFATGMLHMWGHPELAEDFFHDFSGWIVFMLAGAILFGFSILLKRFGATERERKKTKDNSITKGPEEGQGQLRALRPKDMRSETEIKGPRSEERAETGVNVPRASGQSNIYLKPILITALLCLFFLGSGWTLKKLPSAANLPARKSFESFPMTIGDWRAKRSYLSDDILNSLWADDYVSATYFNDGLPNTIHLLIPFYEYQGTRHTAHAPQSCMLGSGWIMLDAREYKVPAGDGNDFLLMTTIWEKGDTRILGSYFFFQRGRVIISPWMNKYWLMVDAFTRQRTDGALVRAELTLVPGQSMDEAYRILTDFMARVWPILDQYVPI